MRIVIDARIISSSTGRYVFKLLEQLDRMHLTHDFIVLVPTKDLSYWRPTGKNFQLIACDTKNYSLAEQTSFLFFLLRLKADLVHFCMPQQPILYFKKHVTTVHDLTLLQTYNSDKNWLLFHAKQFVGRFVFRLVGKTSRHIITPSQFTKDAYQLYARIPASKITVTHEGVGTEGQVSRATPLSLPFKQFIMYVGSQSDYKNIRRLMEAHQQLLAHDPNLGLVLVGGINKSAQSNKTWSEKQQHKNIYYTDFVSDQELAWLYENCQAYVFPSLMEGFGLPGLEAMSHGTPVVSSNASCLPEIYADAAYYFDPLSIDDMTQKITHVLEDEQLRQSLIKKGNERIKAFSWQRMAEQTLQVYEDTLKGK